ncbi:hypothetical protein COU54_05700 [Candidatus Pacearchaeota archaeon CG10_big_fil_rev_8_21_14_0_10_31_24]|nr:MAG: hypothetical protein COU54_05700 [Candidatus Pacearchaeota archaeon CG10_big_fil_rev_8_21_14_0_10_31_24]
MKKAIKKALNASLLSLGILVGSPQTQAQFKGFPENPDIEFSFKVATTNNIPTFELPFNNEVYVRLHGEKTHKTELATKRMNGLFNFTPNNLFDYLGTSPKQHYGTNDFFYPESMDPYGNFTDISGFARDIQKQDPFTNRPLPYNGEGRKEGSGIVAELSLIATNNVLSQINLDGFVSSTTLSGLRLGSEIVRLTPYNIAVVPEPRPVDQSLILYNITKDGVPNPCATGCVDENGSPRTMVLQRAFQPNGPWSGVYTNEITPENKFGSINYFDAEAKRILDQNESSSVFYRVTGEN